MAYTEKYVTDAGAGAATGANLANAWSWATMLTTLAAGDRANYNGAITRTTASDVFTNNGTTANPMAIRAVDGSGVAITPTRTAGGALDMTGVGVITYTTGGLTLPNFCEVSGISLTSAKIGTSCTAGTDNFIDRSKFANTHASTSVARALQANGGGVFISNCDFEITTTDTTTTALNIVGGVVSNSLVIGISSSGAGALSLNYSSAIGCCFRDIGSGITSSGTFDVMVASCSFRNIDTFCIDNTGARLSIINCAAWGKGAGASNRFYNSTTSVRAHGQRNNAVGNMNAADTNEGNWTIEGEVALSADPFTSSSNMTLNSTAGGGTACKGVGLHPYLDIGAWQVQASSSSTAYVIGG